jgi:hypothetical protein
MQAIASTVGNLLAVDSPPEPLWSCITSWSGPLGPSQSQPHNQADCSLDSGCTATTAPPSAPRPSAAPANTSGMTPASAGKAGSADGSEQPQIANLQQHARAQHMNITSLAFQVTARLWELLADASIVGQAQRPASWLASSRSYLDNTCSAMSKMLKACSVLRAMYVVC